jgi:hypothetical protein
VDARGLDADDERLGYLPVGVAAGDEAQDLALARSQPERLGEAVLAVCVDVGRPEVEPRTSGEGLELAQ